MARRRDLAHEVTNGYLSPRTRNASGLHNKKWENLIHFNADGMIVIDCNDVVCFNNRVAAQIYGLSELQLMGRAIDIPPIDVDGSEIEICGNDGEQRVVELRAAPIIWNGSMCRLLSLRDITARKKTEATLRCSQDELRLVVDRKNIELSSAHARLREVVTERKRMEADLSESEERFRLAFEHGSMGKIIFAEGLRILQVNRDFREMLGCSTGDILGKHLAEFAHEDDEPQIRALLDRLKSVETSSFSIELKLRAKPGHTIVTRITAMLLQRTHNAAIHGLALIENITQRVRMEEMRLRQERLAAIGTLAAGIAHEINNPIGASLLAAESALELIDEQQAPASLRECLEDIVSAMERCGEVIRNTMRFSQNVACDKRSQNIHAVIRRARDLTLASQGRSAASIRLELDETIPNLMINDLEIELALVNLIQNAFQNGTETTSVLITTASSVDFTVVTIADNGPGMTPIQKQRAFNPFYTTRRLQGGTGLGLSIVHGIVEDHQGHIEIDSELGRGTAVRICLPITASCPAPSPG